MNSPPRPSRYAAGCANQLSYRPHTAKAVLKGCKYNSSAFYHPKNKHFPPAILKLLSHPSTGTLVVLYQPWRKIEMKSKVININRTRSTGEEKEQCTPTLAIIRHLPLSRISPVFADCTLEELQYFLDRAVQQEEFELCKHLKDLIEFRYTSCVV